MPAAARPRTPLAHFSSFLRSALTALAVAGTALAQNPVAGRLREVRVAAHDVFGSAEPAFLERVVNALHWQTREDVVRREVWLHPGDVVDATLAAELERNLRALRLFAEVTVRLLPTDEPGVVDLEITTRDRLTLDIGAGASYVGGVSGFRASLGEGNLFGLGDRVVGSFAQNSEGEYRGQFSYTDLHVLDSWHTASVRMSRTDEGDSAALEVRRPFKHLADPRAYGFSLAQDDSAVDYYRDGDSLAEVPLRRSSVAGDIAWGDGPRDARRFLGFTFSAEDAVYGTARGPLAPEIRVPGDTWSVFVGPAAAWQWVTGYREVEGLDTLDYVQDLTLGLSVRTTIGARWRDEAGASGALQPEANFGIGLAGEPLPSVFTNVGGNATTRLDGGRSVGWSTNGFARAFWLATDAHTFAASSSFDAVDESQDLLRELTLGEDNGLRGYRARVLSGTRRLRCNLEHRFDTGLELLTLHLGLIAFHDAGWVGRGDSLGTPFESLGFGLRIGSKPLLGDGVVRIDFAKPLDRIDAQSDGWKVSLTIGQVFSFGGYASTLGSR